MAARERGGLEALDRYYGHWQSDASGYYPNVQRTLRSEEQVVRGSARRVFERRVRDYMAAEGIVRVTMPVEQQQLGIANCSNEISGRLVGFRQATHAALEAGESVDPIALAQQYHAIANVGHEAAPGIIDNLRVQLHNVIAHGVNSPTLENQYGALAATLLLTGILNADVDGLTLHMTSELPEDHRSTPGTAFATQPRFTIEPMLAAAPIAQPIPAAVA